MLYLVLSLIAIVIVTAAIGYFSYGKDGDDTIVPPIANCATCNGENDKCEIVWDNINLQDEEALARARLINLQADETDLRIKQKKGEIT